MVQLLRLLCGALIGLFQSSARREAEILVLRQQINVLRRKSPKKPVLNNVDRLLGLSGLGACDRAVSGRKSRRTSASSFGR